MSIRTQSTIPLDRGLNAFLAARQTADAPGMFILVPFDAQDDAK